MKTIIKIAFVVLTSVSLLSSANAGEMTVSGSAKATWTNISDTQGSKGIGIANELTFGANGSLDNGYTWAVAIALDPTEQGTNTSGNTTVASSGAALNDDTSMTIGMPGLGTLGIHVSAGGFNAKYGWASDAYTVMSDTGTSEGASYNGDLGDTANIQFATEAGMLPLGAVLQAGYGYAKTDAQSSNAAGNAGDNRAAYGLTIKPIDGLTVGATYTEISEYGDGTVHGQSEQGGAYYAKFATGPVTIGAGKSYSAPTLSNGSTATTIGDTTTGGTVVEYYENTGISVGYALNDAVRISYTREKNEAHYLTSSTVNYDITQNSYQVAYNIGGATLSLVRHDTDNARYTNNDDQSETLVAIAMAF
jgi:hypothetical protein